MATDYDMIIVGLLVQLGWPGRRTPEPKTWRRKPRTGSSTWPGWSRASPW
jgi:hypothetical protein